MAVGPVWLGSPAGPLVRSGGAVPAGQFLSAPECTASRLTQPFLCVTRTGHSHEGDPLPGRALNFVKPKVLLRGCKCRNTPLLVVTWICCARSGPAWLATREGGHMASQLPLPPSPLGSLADGSEGGGDSFA